MSSDVVSRTLELLRNEKHQGELELEEATRKLRYNQGLLTEIAEVFHWWTLGWRIERWVVRGAVSNSQKDVDIWQQRIDYYESVISALERGEYVLAIQYLEVEIRYLLRHEQVSFGTRTRAQELDDLRRKFMLLEAERQSPQAPVQ